MARPNSSMCRHVNIYQTKKPSLHQTRTPPDQNRSIFVTKSDATHLFTLYNWQGVPCLFYKNMTTLIGFLLYKGPPNMLARDNVSANLSTL